MTTNVISRNVLETYEPRFWFYVSEDNATITEFGVDLRIRNPDDQQKDVDSQDVLTLRPLSKVESDTILAVVVDTLAAYEAATATDGKQLARYVPPLEVEP
jgi:hypothetical protein